MKEQYIRQVEKELNLSRKAKTEVVRDLNEIFNSAGRREKTHHLYVTKRNKAGTGMYFRIPVRSINHVETKTDF